MTIKVTPLLFESYLSFIKASVGSRQFRHLYCQVNGQKRDILNDGELSCAYFASSILVIFSLVKEMHATVSGTVKDMRASGWRVIKRPRAGCVVVWKAAKFPDGELHRHIGFYVGNNRTISNDYKKKSPQTKPLKYRPVEMLLWHPRLEK